MDFKIQSYILHPQILGTDCKIYIDCENARKLKNKLEEYQNNKIWFNIKKLLRLKRYLTILNNYLFILYTKMYKNDKVFEGKRTTINTQIDKLKSEIFSEEKKKIEENTRINDIVIEKEINDAITKFKQDEFYVYGNLSNEDLQEAARKKIFSKDNFNLYKKQILVLENNIINNIFDKENKKKLDNLLLSLKITKNDLFIILIKSMQTGQTGQTEQPSNQKNDPPTN